MPDKTNELVMKIEAGARLSVEELAALYRCPVPQLAALATHRRERLNGKKVFYNRNFHLEPTNICVHNCVFCAYRRDEGAAGSWDYSIDELLAQCRRHAAPGVTEVHIVGGVHPRRDVHDYAALLRAVKQTLPQVHIKAFTAIEIDYMIKKAGMTLEAGLALLKENGLDAIPGGGAEIFDAAVRRRLCPKKGTAGVWLGVHEAAHRLGIRTNATMLFGHVENLEHRLHHLLTLRELQDRTGGFDAFIPLKYKSEHNALGRIGEVSVIETLRMVAISRLALDNIPHIKAYWPMLGKDVMQMALLFGADDIDGTINDTTKIYSMAGAGEQHPSMSVDELRRLVHDAGFEPVERDTFYNIINFSIHNS
ncbi:MAG: CofH family radical SAM protein [Prevotellaceae bacterium]|jgi:aminodeoxyfutalosine synthase|nr:CofH family radical SAM protein [Prevotellaceae bacterium]